MNTTSYGYDLNGKTVINTLGNGLLEELTHDASNRVSTLKNQNSSGSDLTGYVCACGIARN